MGNIEFFHHLESTSTLINHLRNRIAEATEDDWQLIIEMNCLLLTIDDFKTEPKLIEFIEHMNCQQKLAIYRFKPNTCYKWHIDHAGRNCCINMLIDGYDSLTMFGVPAMHGQFVNITKLIYKPNKYVLLDVHKFHTVFNFSEDRYLLSIGVPSPTTYNETKQYLIDNNL
jgi:hypothetical protein